MAKVTALHHSFAVGEMSRAGMARIDQERTRLGAETQYNLLPYTVGKAQVRPGTKYLGETIDANRARLIPFVKAIDDTALLEMTDSVLRVWVSDALVTRAAVTSSVGDGDFAAAGSWTTSTTGSAVATISGGVLTLGGVSRGGVAICKQAVTTSTTGTEHALRIEITQGACLFRCGSADGGDDYITETTLEEGIHSLAFTPSTSPYYIRFTSRSAAPALVTSITVEAPGVMEIAAPWTTAQLRSIRVDQSGDVVFLAHRSWQQRKIERRATRSWSLVKYKTGDGPFITAGRQSLTISASVGEGSGTLTASDALFKSTDVGALIYLDTSGHDNRFHLSGAEQYTPGVRLFGIGSDNDYAVNRNGTFSGTLTLQRSYSGPDTGFVDTNSTYTGTGNTAVTPGSSYNNVEHWVRVGFKDGDYTSGSAGVKITYAGGSEVGYARVTGYTSETEVSMDVTGVITSSLATPFWRWPAWSDRFGWPSAVGLFDGRLFWGGLDKIWGSESDDYYAFNLETEGDSGSIQRNIATGASISEVVWFLPLQRLIVGTRSSEISVRSSSFDEPLTPSNITMRDAATNGVADVSPIKVDSRGVYVQRSGKKLYELVYDFEVNDYRATDITRLNDEIGESGLLELAAQRQPETYIWAVRGDGQAVITLYEPQESVVGFVRFVPGGTDAAVESVAVLPESDEDAVYLALSRTIDGVTVRSIEKLAKHTSARGGAINLMADAYVTDAGPTSSVAAPHLVNETGLVAWATNADGDHVALTGLSADGAGDVALGATYTDVCLGLSYDWRYKSAKLAYGAQNGTALLQTKLVRRVGLLLADTHPDAIQFGPSFDDLDIMPRVERGAAIDTDALHTTYDERLFPFYGNWDTDSRVCLTGSAPYPATLLGLVMTVETHED